MIFDRSKEKGGGAGDAARRDNGGGRVSGVRGGGGYNVGQAQQPFALNVQINYNKGMLRNSVH